VSFRSIFREGLFKDKTIIVSGGGTGIGRATARELAGLGATVVICSRSAEHLEPARDEIVAAGGQATAIPCNIRDPQSVEDLFTSVLARHGRIDALVNNAGGQFLSPAARISPRGWHAVVETNLTGTFYMTQAAFTHYMRDHGGAIVNIVAEVTRGFPNMAHSGAARAGVINLTKSLALEWAQHGIRVNAVAPGLINSSGLQTYAPEIQAQFLADAQEVPAQRMGTESEVAAAITYLLSPAAAFISGTTLYVDGAASLYRLRDFVIPEHTPWPAYESFDDEG